MEIKIEITFTAGDKEVKLTEVEAKELYVKLNDLYGPKYTYSTPSFYSPLTIGGLPIQWTANGTQPLVGATCDAKLYGSTY